MSHTKKILKALMDKNGLNAHDLYRLSGVSPPTTYRFLTGRHDEPKASTILAWAHALGVTEGQLRGTEPIDGVNTPDRARDLQDLLTPDEYNLVERVKNMDKASRGILYQLAERLVLAEPEADYCPSGVERRKEDVYPNRQLRIGESRYKSPTNKRRKKINFDDRNYHATKTSHTA